METKIVAITGCYKGIGAALSRALAKKGYKLILGGRNKTDLDRFTEEMKKITDVIGIVMDVRNKIDCERFINSGVDKFGHLDILINNAGIWNMASIEEVTEQELKDMFEVNTFGPIYCSQAAIPIMKKQGTGHILNIGATAAIEYKSSHLAYGASKAAIIWLTGYLREELKGSGIRVFVFSPGGTKTEIFRSKPERLREDFMDPNFVAEKIIEHIENPSDEWHIILRRPKIVSK